jgi:hypothetical protein
MIDVRQEVLDVVRLDVDQPYLAACGAMYRNKARGPAAPSIGGWSVVPLLGPAGGDP